MKTRVISGLIGIAVLFAVMGRFHSRVFNITLFVLYSIAVKEIANAFKDSNVKYTSFLLWAAGVIAFILPVFNITNLNYILLFALFSTGFATIVVFNFDKINFMPVAAEIAFGVYVLFGFWSALRFKELLPYHTFGWDGPFMVIFCAVLAWGGDTCAYFAGFLFGKHKLAPTLSPKKTKEGAVGGVLGSVVLTWFIFWAYSILKPLLEGTMAVYTLDVKHMMTMGLVAACGSVVGMVGDLFASAIKRHVGIKDYGNLMPGHGGVLDRFDSILLVAPLVSSTVNYIVQMGGVFNV